PEQIVSSLLDKAGEPAQLAGIPQIVGQLFEELDPNVLKGALGSTLAGGFSPTTVEAVAGGLGTSPAELATRLGQSTEQLSPDTAMLTAPLANGQLLGVAPALKGLALGLLGGQEGGGEPETGGGQETGGEREGGQRETGGGQETGGQPGGPEGSGGGGVQNSPRSPGPTKGGQSGDGGQGGLSTLVVNIPQGPSQTAATQVGKAAHKAVRFKILSHHVNGTKATLVLQVPAPGK